MVRFALSLFACNVPSELKRVAIVFWFSSNEKRFSFNAVKLIEKY